MKALLKIFHNLEVILLSHCNFCAAMKKTLAIATFSLLCIGFVIPHSTAFGQEVLTFEIENKPSPQPQTNPVRNSPSEPENLAPAIDQKKPVMGIEPLTWDYQGTNSPETWGNLSEEFALCTTGQNQSPIDLDPEASLMTEGVELNYATVVFEVVNNGHSVQVNYPKGSTANIGGETYDLLQFHFHTPSEHTVAGKASEMEVHLVHTNAAGDLAVISAMVEPGPESDDVSKIWRNIPEVGASKKSDLVINAANLLPKDLTHISYSGSLTTPPCSEDVTWLVMKEPITLSLEQIKTFQNLYPMNARPTQRTIQADE